MVEWWKNGMVEEWNDGRMEWWKNGMMEELTRKNINRGFTKLEVWKDSISLYELVYDITKDFPYELLRSRNNILDASHSISRNIAEGYCRRNLKEYLNFLYIALGSCGELLSGFLSFKRIKQITDENFEKFDILHYKTENELISLIKSLQNKQKNGTWSDSFIE
jgi:four helix bundle protein